MKVDGDSAKETLNPNDQQNTRNRSTITSNVCGKYNVLSILIAVTSVITIIIIAADECQNCFKQLEKSRFQQEDSKKYWVYGRNVESGYLKTVFLVLDRLGYKNDPNTSDWDVLWAHDYPFRKLYQQLSNLRKHQRINHFPGCGYVTNKVDLATSGLKYIPPAFKLPEDKDKLLKYADKNPNMSFVEKSNDHRNIHVRKLQDINLDKEGTFVQEFVHNPLLVDGYKFDIGIYTIVTSIDPLRVYIYNGDALLRFCPVKYYPFDPNNLDKYVVGDDYLPIWEVPSLDYYYNKLGFGMRETLNAFLEARGQNSQRIWEQIDESIRILFLAKEPKIIEVINKFKTKRNYFEMMRIDFIVDEELNVYLLEANMSPNLSSAHFPPNQLLYEQVLYNMMSLVGIGQRMQKNSLVMSQAEENMIVTDKNLATFAKECESPLCRSSCTSPTCQLCIPCLSLDTKEYLIEAYKEHVNKGDCKRIFPPQMERHFSTKNKDIDVEDYSAENQLQYRWFQGKCNLDSSWC